MKQKNEINFKGKTVELSPLYKMVKQLELKLTSLIKGSENSPSKPSLERNYSLKQLNFFKKKYGRYINYFILFFRG